MGMIEKESSNWLSVGTLWWLNSLFSFAFRHTLKVLLLFSLLFFYALYTKIQKMVYISYIYGSGVGWKNSPKNGFFIEDGPTFRFLQNGSNPCQ